MNGLTDLLNIIKLPAVFPSGGSSMSSHEREKINRGDEGVATCGYHHCGVPMHKEVCSETNITYHLVTTPPYNKAYHIGVNVVEKDHHGTPYP